MHLDGSDDIQDLRSLPVLPTIDLSSPHHLSAISTTVPLVRTDDTNTAESRNEELKLAFCHNQLNNNNNNNNNHNCYNNTNTNDTITTTATTTTTTTTIFNINSNNNFNNGDNIDFDFENMTIRNHIPLLKPNSFEASCSSSDIYGDNDWSVKMANTDLYQHQQQPYLNYSNAQDAEIPDLISLPASLGSYDRCKATTGNILFDDNNHLASPKEYYSVECIKDAHYNMEMNDDKPDNFYPLEFGRFPLQPHQQHHAALLNSSNVVMPKLETPLLGESIIQNRIDDSVHSCQLSTNSDGNVPMHSNNQQKMFQPCQPKRKPGRPRLHPLNKDSAGIKKSKLISHYYGKDIIERVEGRRLVYRFLNSAMDRLRKKTNPEIPLSEMQRN
ncbi:Hypothetical predicted protein [Octopus vulgaris]|uniref:ETS domain-containing protein n=1 Tax=Octopus vulgaris TaxID=6645 RepID=A0AA36F5M1_OCTVU|nr:Hypothetical predicted protein [Octopus vulgaris]